MPSRRKARECALQLLFQWDLARDLPDKILELYWSNTSRLGDEEVQEFAAALFRGAVESVDELDATIRQHTENWRLERMAAVDRNILRLAVYEMTASPGSQKTPPLVVINEALEIARRYSGEDSVPFINGILDSIRKSMEAVPRLTPSD